ncbi:MAG: hypothetical protein Q9M30_10635 [Mariprofundaceae bacterium]|nr:hypothetical protein [Mariprofundaceae bacterium]
MAAKHVPGWRIVNAGVMSVCLECYVLCTRRFDGNHGRDDYLTLKQAIHHRERTIRPSQTSTLWMNVKLFQGFVFPL